MKSGYLPMGEDLKEIKSNTLFRCIKWTLLLYLTIAFTKAEFNPFMWDNILRFFMLIPCYIILFYDYFTS